MPTANTSKSRSSRCSRQSASSSNSSAKSAARRKSEFLGDAAALLFPIDWPEPFGLVMIEAMACGTPVIAFRRGSVPEVMDDGVTGFVVDNVEEAVQAVARLGELSRLRCRQVFEGRFSAGANGPATTCRLSRELVENATGTGTAGAMPWRVTPPGVPPLATAGARGGSWWRPMMIRFTGRKRHEQRCGCRARRVPAGCGRREARLGRDGKSPYYILAPVAVGRRTQPGPQARRDVRRLRPLRRHQGRPASARKGIYHEGTRFLSCLLLAWNRPALVPQLDREGKTTWC